MTSVSTPGHAARRLAALAFALFACALQAADLTGTVPSHDAGGDATVQRGEYLARAADCFSCHSEPGQPPFSGGAALSTPFGKLYAPNITPDPKTGIGNWTAEDFAKALREGVNRHGEALYPAMPYESYTQLTDPDVAALWAFMRSVPAVRRASRPNTLRFPMNLRAGVAVWQAAFFHPGRFEAESAKSAPWNRGAYLVNALGHCSACHTPRNSAMALQESQGLSGARIENWYAPDIRSDALSRLAGRSVDDLARLLKTGTGPGNVVLAGPMQEVVHDSLRHLTDADLHAMAVFLKDQPPSSAAATVAVPQTPDPQQRASGRAVYQAHCASCHGEDGKGRKQVVPALAGAGGPNAREPTTVVTAVLQGFDLRSPWTAMPAFAGVLDDAEIAAVANHVRHSWGNQGEQAATPWTVSALRRVATLPPGGTRAGLLCPQLPAEALQAALKPGPKMLLASGQDPAVLARVVADYRKARPGSSADQVITALSAAYCRALSDSGASFARTGAGLADYSQQVARVLLPDGLPAHANSRRGATP